MGLIVSNIYLFLYIKDLYSIFVLIFSIILYIIISFFLFRYNNKIIVLIENISFYTYIITFLISFLLNPGIPKREYYYSKKVNKEYKGDFSKLKNCPKCNIIIPKSLKVGHCVYCNICIRNYDHHCPWIGKCIGRYTKIPFYIFLISVLIYIINSILIFITYIKMFI